MREQIVTSSADSPSKQPDPRKPHWHVTWTHIVVAIIGAAGLIVANLLPDFFVEKKVRLQTGQAIIGINDTYKLPSDTTITYVSYTGGAARIKVNDNMEAGSLSEGGFETFYGKNKTTCVIILTNIDPNKQRPANGNIEVVYVCGQEN